jgi:hypothetical protein
MHFVSVNENKTMKHVEIVLKRGKGGRGRMMEGVNLRHIANTHVNIKMYLPVQLLYANQK